MQYLSNPIRQISTFSENSEPVLRIKHIISETGYSNLHEQQTTKTRFTNNNKCAGSGTREIKYVMLDTRKRETTNTTF